MEQELDKEQLDYIFFHISHHVSGWHRLSSRICYGNDTANHGQSIIFHASSKPIDKTNILYFNGIPILFPGDKLAGIWSLTAEGKLIFHHDILKSAFYLLSGYHEWIYRDKVDGHGRFDYSFSIQKQLNIISKPVVNYYFDLIQQGVLAYSRFHGLQVASRHPFYSPIFLLTHDVDRVHFFNLKSLMARWVKVLNPFIGQNNGRHRIQLALKSLKGLFLPVNHPENVYWSFPFLLKVQEDLGIRSTWFMLNKKCAEPGADYSFSEPIIMDLVERLQANGHEVGLHGSMLSNQSTGNMIEELDNFVHHFKFVPAGARQHFLYGQLPGLFRQQAMVGLKYDSTMGFAAHEGFRHSYCHPYKPFDHEKGLMINLWELPLMVMDTTLFAKRGLNEAQALATTCEIAKEVARFNGVFTLLWHNCQTNPWVAAGRDEFFQNLIRAILQVIPKSFTCRDALAIFEKNVGQEF